jgi:hypothetical protein
MEQNPSQEANSRLSTQKIPSFYRRQRFITVLTTARLNANTYGCQYPSH